MKITDEEFAGLKRFHANHSWKLVEALEEERKIAKAVKQTLHKRIEDLEKSRDYWKTKYYNE